MKVHIVIQNKENIMGKNMVKGRPLKVETSEAVQLWKYKDRAFYYFQNTKR